MSHVITAMVPATVAGEAPKVWEIPDSRIADFAKACMARGLEGRGRTTYKMYPRWLDDYAGHDAAFKHGVKPETYGTADKVFGLRDNTNAYELGLQKTAPGTNLVVFDNFAGGYGLCEAIGRHGELLHQTYTQILELEKQGIIVPVGASARAIDSCMNTLPAIQDQGLVFTGEVTLGENGWLNVVTEPNEQLLIQAGC